MKGTVFDIKEFSVYDGPGVRVTVFLKGCPLRCEWCHNPEGLSPSPQIMVSVASCVDCGACAVDGCPLSGGRDNLSLGATCRACGRCVEKCPLALRKITGTVYEASELAEKIMKNVVFLSDGGGVTFSGGEPTLQADFMLEVMSLLPLHKAVQTCGFCPKDKFLRVIDACDLMFFDIKHTDPVLHKRYTGVGNELILENLAALKRSGKPFIARLPLISEINFTEEHLTRAAQLLSGSSGLLRVELLPYNSVAGAKYSMTGKRFDGGMSAPVIGEKEILVFNRAGLECKVM
jgi:pyruvate formate lyase activating enzyme